MLGLGVLLLTSCTANFCSSADQASMAYPYDQGATVYLSKEAYQDLKNNGDEATKTLIAQEEAWSAEAEALGLPSIAGPAYGAANDRVYKYLP